MTQQQPAAPARPDATLVRRLASMLYEMLLLAGVLALTFMVPYLILGVVWNTTLPGWFLWLHVFVVLGAYFIWYWRNGGQTLAMQTWRLRLVDTADGGPVSLNRAMIRYVLTWPSLLCFGAGIVWSLFDRQKQFLHDRLAGTRIVQLPKN